MRSIKQTINLINELIDIINEKVRYIGFAYMSGDIVPFLYNDIAVIPKKIEVYVTDNADKEAYYRAFQEANKNLYDKKIIYTCTGTNLKVMRYLLRNAQEVTISFKCTNSVRDHKVCNSNLIHDICTETIESYIANLQPETKDEVINLLLSRQYIPKNDLSIYKKAVETIDLSKKNSPLILTTSGQVIDNKHLYDACFKQFMSEIITYKQ